ncbi:DUF1707 SHOCT-like domain-containing protein [Micromonospora kangleipakensis]|nr:DUF1707 domain-containing protein [Micromonospora kangleipakensis]
MDGRDGMRAADADRQEAAERLRVALEEGRIDLYEYDERLQRTYGAKTYGELGQVLADLPGPAPLERSGLAPRQPGPADVAAPVPPAAAPAPASGPVPSGVRGNWLLEVWMPWLRVAVILNAIWLLSAVGAGELIFYWPLWVLGPWGAVLLMRTAGGLAGGEPRHRDDRGSAAGAADRPGGRGSGSVIARPGAGCARGVRFPRAGDVRAGRFGDGPQAGVHFQIGAQRPLRHAHPALRWESEPRLARARRFSSEPV